MRDVYVVILVGGKGKRLRPLSTNARPKAFLSVTRDRKTMFRRTVDRARQLVRDSHILVVANRTHKNLVINDFPSIRRDHLLLESVSRNTAPAIAVAASVIHRESPGAVMVMIPVDQYILNERLYFDALNAGIQFMKRSDGELMPIGVVPEFPSTQFGYIKLGHPSSFIHHPSVFTVERFVEKPDLATAKKYLKDGRYLWNTGAFVFKVDTFLETLKAVAPEIARLASNPERALRFFRRFPNISIDYAVMEKAKRIVCVRGEYHWKDMGSFESIMEILRLEKRDFIEKGNKVVKIL